MRRARLLLLLPLLVGLLPAASLVAEEGGETRRVGLVRVRGDGPVQLSLERLRALGIEDPLRVAVHRAGEPIPVFTAAEAGSTAGHVVFPARATAGPHGAHAVYEVLRLPRPRPAYPMPISPGVWLARHLDEPAGLMALPLSIRTHGYRYVDEATNHSESRIGNGSARSTVIRVRAVARHPVALTAHRLDR